MLSTHPRAKQHECCCQGHRVDREAPVVRLMIHAPNVHTGGGLTLLREALAALPSPSVWAQLDDRARGRLAIPAGVDARYVKHSLRSRLAAEWRLWRASRDDSLVLCFHGMPPCFPVRGRVVVFQQNVHLLGMTSLRGFPRNVALRIIIERWMCRLFRGHVDEYVVQSPSMARALTHWHGNNPRLRILPFAGAYRAPVAPVPSPVYDFVYVASGDAHKNHRCLLDAWVLLAEDGLFPSLVLTVGSDNPGIIERLDALRAAHGIRIDNLPDLGAERVLALYLRARALIFPSTAESFGLPLLEAAAVGLPIVAAERDYVRDVVTPVETFDPQSPVSIARAVRRFLGCAEAPVRVMTPAEFMERVLHP